MSRNLCQTDCYFCSGEIVLKNAPHAITAAEAGCYFDEYEGMIVADAECVDCEAKYLAWVDEAHRRCYRRESVPDAGKVCVDLSFRSSFDDEPGREDLPKWKIEERAKPVVTVRSPWPTWPCGEPKHYSYCERCKVHHAL